MSDDNARGYEDRRIDVLLNEYQAGHRNRNHYDSVRWTVGSILIATSFALLGLSFQEKIYEEFWAVNFMAFFSIWLFLLWYIYNQYVNPYIMGSILRMHEIEQELRDGNFDIRLHKSIFKETSQRRLKATYITSFEFGLVFVAWILRNLLLRTQNSTYSICAIIILSIGLIFALILHFTHYNTKDWKKGIKGIIDNKKNLKEKKKPDHPPSKCTLCGK